MSEEKNEQASVDHAALMKMVADMQKNSTAEVNGWKKSKRTNPVEIQGVSVPVKIPWENGNIRIYVHLPAVVAESPETLIAALEYLKEEMGLPLDSWQKKESSWSGGRGRRW